MAAMIERAPVIGQHVRIELSTHLNLLVIVIYMVLPHLAVETPINPGLEDFLLLSQHLSTGSAISCVHHAPTVTRLNEVIL